MIRQATPQDVPAMAALHAACFDKAWKKEEFKALLGDSAVRGFIADHGIILVRVAADEAEVLTLCVCPSARGSGLATALVRHAAQALACAGAVRVFLEVGAKNAVARALYGKLGFEQAGWRKDYYGLGADAVVLTAGLPLGNAVGSTSITPLEQGLSRDAD